jgi:hypothetical protein
MKQYIVTIQGEMMDIVPLEDECACQDKCFDVEELEATMLAIIQSMRETLRDHKRIIMELDMRIAEQDVRIADLEKRQLVQWVYPVTYPAPTTDYPVPWWERDQFTCKQ